MSKRCLPTLETAVLGISFLWLIAPFQDADTFLHLATGRWIETHGVPRTDPFSHTLAGKEWIAHEWLAALAMHAASRLGGLPLVAWGTALIGLLTLLCVGSILSLQGVLSPRARCASLVFAALLIQVNMLARPHLVTILLITVVDLILRRHRLRGERRLLLLLPPLFVLWANCHGGFVLGALPFLAALAHAVVESKNPGRRELLDLVGIGPLCLVACCVNPRGPDLLLFPLGFRPGSRFLQPIQEWIPPDLENATRPWILLLIAIAVHVARPVRPRAGWIVLVPVLLLMLQARRSTFLLGIFLAPILAESLESPTDRTGPRGSRSVAWLVVFLAVGGWWANAQQLVNPERFPVAAVDWIRKFHPPGPMFNNYDEGGYLIHELEGSYPVFIDGRIEIYQRHGVLHEYNTILETLPGWDRLLDSRRINLVLDWNFTPLADSLRAHPAWRLMLDRDNIVIFVRAPPAVSVGAPREASGPSSLPDRNPARSAEPARPPR